jgi:hypothetical protein
MDTSLFTGDSRGAIPVVGQVILLSLIIGTTITASAAAVTIYNSQQAAIQDDVMIEAVSDYESQAETTAVTAISRNATVSPPAGSTRVGQSNTTITFNDGTGSTGLSHTVTTDDIVFETTDSTLIYSGGLVAQQTPRGERVIEPLDQTAQRESSGNSVYRLRVINTTVTQQRVLSYPISRDIVFGITPGQTFPKASSFKTSGSTTATVTIDSQHPDVWTQYLQNHPGFDSIIRTDTTVTANVSTGTTIQVTSVSTRTAVLDDPPAD